MSDTPTTIRYTAPCPTCGMDATWHAAQINYGKGVAVQRIDCPSCGPGASPAATVLPKVPRTPSGWGWVRALASGLMPV